MIWAVNIKVLHMYELRDRNALMMDQYNENISHFKNMYHICSIYHNVHYLLLNMHIVQKFSGHYSKCAILIPQCHANESICL